VNHDTTVLFGLPGVQVRHVEQVEFGERVVHVETADESAAGCPSCGVASTSVKQYVRATPRDLPYGETGVSVVWHKRHWRCVEPDCARGSFTEAIGEVPSGWRTTGRLRRAIAVAVSDACRSVAEVAGSFEGPADGGCRGRAGADEPAASEQVRPQIVTPPPVAPPPAISPVTVFWDWLINLLRAWFPGSERVSAAADQGCRSSLYRAEPPRHAPRTRCGERGTRVAAISRCHQTTPEAFCTRRSTSRSMRSDGGYRVLTPLADGYLVEQQRQPANDDCGHTDPAQHVRGVVVPGDHQRNPHATSHS